MLKSEVTEFVNTWLIDDKKVFKTYNYFSLDYIVIQKINEDLYKCLIKHSTTDMGSFNRDEMIRMIGANIFIDSPFEHWNQDFHEVRSQGCICGANSTNDPNCHDFRCPKHKK